MTRTTSAFSAFATAAMVVAALAAPASCRTQVIRPLRSRLRLGVAMHGFVLGLAIRALDRRRAVTVPLLAGHGSEFLLAIGLGRHELVGSIPGRTTRLFRLVPAQRAAAAIVLVIAFQVVLDVIETLARILRAAFIAGPIRGGVFIVLLAFGHVRFVPVLVTPIGRLLFCLTERVALAAGVLHVLADVLVLLALLAKALLLVRHLESPSCRSAMTRDDDIGPCVSAIFGVRERAHNVVHDECAFDSSASRHDDVSPACHACGCASAGAIGIDSGSRNNALRTARSSAADNGTSSSTSPADNVASAMPSRYSTRAPSWRGI